VTFVDYLQSGDSSAEELSSVTQVTGPVLPIVRPRLTAEIVSITDEMKAEKGYYKLRLERTNAKLVGIRKKRAEAAEKEEKK
jgi:large subunit ribosomal protein L13e